MSRLADKILSSWCVGVGCKDGELENAGAAPSKGMMPLGTPTME